MLAAAVQGLGSGAIYALVAVGIVLMFKGSKVLNLAQGELGAFALFVALWLTGHAKSAAAGAAVLVVTIVLSAVLGVAMEVLVMRPLVERPPVQATIATLGVAIVLINVELLLGRPGVFLAHGQSSYPVVVPPTVGTWNVQVLGATLRSSQVVGLVMAAAAAAALYAFFTRTKFGLAVVAATSDHTVARILGVPVQRVHLFTWGVGGALSGLAAALIAPFAGSFTPATMTFVLIGALAAAVIGGLDSIFGAIVGGLLIGLVVAVSGYVFEGAEAVGQVAVLVLVVGTLLVRPRGLFGGVGVELS